MPSRNLVVSDKMQLPNGTTVSSGGGEIHHPGAWFPDERDGFISWLRAEFAAANAIIDSLCQHLLVVGEPGEYDSVIGHVQQRRAAWNSVLHLQQFFPISDVMLAVQQVGWRRQQRALGQSRPGGKEFKRSDVHSFGSRYGQVAEATKKIHSLSVNSPNLGANGSVMGSKEKNGTVRGREDMMKPGHDVRKPEEKGLLDTQKVTDCSLKPSMNRDEADNLCTKSLSADVKDETLSNSKGSCNLNMGENSDPIQNQKEEGLKVLPKTFCIMEMNSGKMVNITKGLNLYEKVIDDEEVSKLISLVNDLKATGKRGQLPGPTFVDTWRPYRVHGKEMIQLGIAIYGSSDDNPAKDWIVEPIPDLLQSVIDRLISMQLTPTKPDSCIIDIFNEGDYSHPQYYPLRYGRPICLLSLNECDMVFGATGENGAFRGAFNLTLSPGSLLVMQGNSTDITKLAIPSIRKHRILITFLKPQRSKAFQGGGDGTRLLPLQASSWGPPPNHIHYTPLPMTGVLPAPPIRAPPLLAPPPGPTTGWPASAPRHLPPRVPVPGTGVFLPVETKFAGGEMGSTVKTTHQVETENDDEKVSDDDY